MILAKIDPTDLDTATCILKQYLKRTYGKDVMYHIGYKGESGRQRLTALVHNALIKKDDITDTDIENARKKLEYHINKWAGVEITGKPGKEFPWQKDRGVCTVEKKEKKRLPLSVIEKIREKEEKGKPVKYRGYISGIGEIRCRKCHAKMETGQIVCTQCGTMR